MRYLPVHKRLIASAIAMMGFALFASGASGTINITFSSLTTPVAPGTATVNIMISDTSNLDGGGVDAINGASVLIYTGASPATATGPGILGGAAISGYPLLSGPEIENVTWGPQAAALFGQTGGWMSTYFRRFQSRRIIPVR